MKMKPILFNTEMVKTILAGRKTVTRRAIKIDLGLADTDRNDNSYLFVADEYGDHHNVKDLCQYKVGDILYVRETWKKYDKRIGTGIECHLESFIRYKADENTKIPSEFFESKWKPSIHMPKEAARIFLKVTNVKVQKLQNITEYEVFAEGLEWFDDRCADENWIPSYHDPDSGGTPQMRKGFETLWNSTIKKQDLERYGWKANPWVWVIEFERIEKPL